MFLTRMIERAHRDDRGAALVAVVGVMAVGLILTSLIMSATVGGIGFTSAAVANVQSQAASDAGIAIARAQVESGACTPASTPRFVSAEGALPEYDVTVQRPSATGGWESGCPLATDTQVRFISTGDADALGVAGNTNGDQSAVEAVYNLPAISAEVAESGPAIYAYSSTGFAGSGKLVSIDGSSPSVLVKEGSVTCAGAANTAADWVINDGNFTGIGSCVIPGNVWATGNVVVDGGSSIGGNLVANSLTMAGSGKVEKSVWTTTSTKLDWSSNVLGDVTAETIQFNGGDVKGMSWARTNASFTAYKNIAGSLTAKATSGSYTPQQFVQGTITVSPLVGTGPVAPATPQVAPWVNFKYTKSDWVGFNEVVVSGSNNHDTGPCGYVNLQNIVNSFGTSPGIIDARGCTSVEISSYKKLTMNADLVIVAKKFSLAGSGGFVSGGGEHKVWLINEDATIETPTDPTCNSQQMSIGGDFTFDRGNLAIMIYSPCKVTIASGTKFNGQIFAGQASIAGAAEIGYVPIGLPNVNLTTGGSASSVVIDTSLTLVSIRNVSTGG